jgi:predicted enzyme related to lactoylglutathione lyase
MATKKTKKKKTVAKRAAPKKAAPKKAAPKKAARSARATKAPKPRVHSVVHWEIQSRDPARLHDFYSGALGWKIDANNPMNYGMVASKGRDGINGGIGGSQGGSRVVVYSAVPSIPSILDRIASLGGRTVMPRTDIGPVIMALYEDPEGNVMGLIEG